MKMNLVYAALFAVLLGVSPALANDSRNSSRYDDCPDQSGQQEEQCDPVQQDDPNQDYPDQDYPDQEDPQKKPYGNAHYNWGRGQNGFGYCYAFNKFGQVMYNGMPQPNFYCEKVRRSHFNWGRSWDGYIYCYQFTPYLAVMNDGRPVPPGYCRY